jgi:hypothetical protein
VTVRVTGYVDTVALLCNEHSWELSCSLCLFLSHCTICQPCNSLAVQLPTLHLPLRLSLMRSARMTGILISIPYVPAVVKHCGSGGVTAAGLQNCLAVITLARIGTRVKPTGSVWMYLNLDTTNRPDMLRGAAKRRLNLDFKCLSIHIEHEEIGKFSPSVLILINTSVCLSSFKSLDPISVSPLPLCSNWSSSAQSK